MFYLVVLVKCVSQAVSAFKALTAWVESQCILREIMESSFAYSAKRLGLESEWNARQAGLGLKKNVSGTGYRHLFGLIMT